MICGRVGSHVVPFKLLRNAAANYLAELEPVAVDPSVADRHEWHLWRQVANLLCSDEVIQCLARCWGSGTLRGFSDIECVVEGLVGMLVKPSDAVRSESADTDLRRAFCEFAKWPRSDNVSDMARIVGNMFDLDQSLPEPTRRYLAAKAVYRAAAELDVHMAGEYKGGWPGAIKCYLFLSIGTLYALSVVCMLWGATMDGDDGGVLQATLWGLAIVLGFCSLVCGYRTGFFACANDTAYK